MVGWCLDTGCRKSPTQGCSTGTPPSEVTWEVTLYAQTPNADLCLVGKMSPGEL